MVDPERTDRRRDLPAGVIAVVVVLILVPIVALMLVGTYARKTPELWGFPFFYWYQFMWVFLTAALTWVAYLLLRRARGGGDR